MKKLLETPGRKYGRQLVLFFSLGLLSIFFGFYDVNAGIQISQNEAINLIQSHLHPYGYDGSILIGEFKISLNDEENSVEAKKTCEKLRSLGLIDFSIKYDSNELENVFTTSLTEKGKKHNHAWLEWNTNVVIFEMGYYENVEIVKIDEKENLVYSAVEYIPNDLDKALGREKNKYRVKAKIVYDDFLKKLVWKGAMGCAWEGGDWYKTSWIWEKNGETLFNTGIRSE